MYGTLTGTDRKRAQTETIGVVLLTGIIIVTVSAASVLIVVNFTQQAGGEGPATDVSFAVTDDDLTITHRGGDAVAESSVRVVVRSASGERRYALATDPIDRDGDGDSRFEPGESATFLLPGSWTGPVTVSVIDADRNVLITSRDTAIPADTTIEPANFAVQIDNTNSPVVAGETIVVRPRISNTGDELGTQTVELSVDGTVVDSDLVTVEAGDSQQIDLGWPTSVGDAGTYTVTVSTENASVTESVTVRSEPYFDVRIDNTNSPVVEGGNLSVGATVENTGGAPDIQNVRLNVTGQANPVDVENIGVNPSDSWTLTLYWPTASNDAGTYDATVSSEDDSATATVSVEPPNVPTVTSIRLAGAPINYTEAGASDRTLTIRYSDPMNQAVTPTVTLSGESISDAPTDDGWINSTTYVARVDVRQDGGDEETVTVSVSGAEDTDGNAQADASATVLVDTQRPGDVTDVVTKPDINASTQTAVTYGIRNPDTVYGDEDIRVTLTGSDGGTVTQRTPIQAGGDNVTDVTLGASALADGPVSISAVAIDDVNNTGATVTESGIVKDTVAPLITNYAVTSDNNREFTVTFDATEETTTVDDVSISATGPGSATRIDSNNVTSGNTTSFSLTYSVDVNGQYDVKLVRVLDSVGNNGSSGETEIVDTQGGGSGTVADANGPYTVDEGGSITLDGSASTTQTGGAEYNWTIVSGSGTITDDSLGTPNATYTAPSDVTGDTTVTVELTVTDSQGTDSTTTTVTVRDLDPQISDFTVTNPQSDEVAVSFDSDEELSTIGVSLTRDGTPVATLDETDVSTSDTSALYTYTGTYRPGRGGTYEATLDAAADADGNDGASGESASVTISENTTAIQFSNFDGFDADPTADEFTLDQINVQDADNDDDLDRVEYRVIDSAGNVVATETVTGIGPAEYQAQQPAVTISGTVQAGETYTLVGTAYDADENFVSQSLSATAPSASNPDTIAFSNFDGFEADSVSDELTLDQIQVQDADGDDDLDRIVYDVTDSDGNSVATETVTGIGPAQYQPSGSPAVTISASDVQEGETYTLTATVYDADENFDSRSLSATSDVYTIESVSATAGNGNRIEVTTQIDTTDPGAQIEVQSLAGDGTVIDSTGLVPVADTQPQTETVDGKAGNTQATQVRVILYDAASVEAERQTVAAP